MLQKALIIVPHQDDETDLAGNIIDVIKTKYDLYVLYSSLDADKKKGYIRKREAINACAVWGIPKSKIVFLDYPDTPNVVGKHWYINESKRIVDDLKTQILCIRPAIIFATDFDYHSDHRMLSLAFDNAMGQILKDNLEYRPLVLKGFCYETAFYSVEDYKASNLGTSVSNINPLSNPSYEWKNRISIQSNEKPGVIWKRKAYKALAKHKSQYAVLHARSIVNADNVFWGRRTDNLLYKASLMSSVQNIEKICDFIILDTDDIITHNPRQIDYSKSTIIFERGDYIKAEWEQPVCTDSIIFHGSVNQTDDINTNITITVNGEVLDTINVIKPYGRDTCFKISNPYISSLIISFESEPIELSEIEVLKGNMEYPFESTYTQAAGGFVDLLDKIGYKFIVIFTRLRRKLRNTLHI